VGLGERPYDFYSLETAEDLEALSAVLKNHHDCMGRTPPMVMNFIVANVDFSRCFGPSTGFIPMLPLSEGLPGQWRRPGLLDGYRQGIEDGVFFPALHGLTHFCPRAMTRELVADGERAQLVRTMWRAGTPYIHWRMPWIGYEYWDPAPKPELQFLSLDEQRSAIQKAMEIYRTLFSSGPVSACAPGYRANADTRSVWFEAGVRVAQNGPGQRKLPYLDQQGMLHTFRTIEMEPAVAPSNLESLMQQAEGCFRIGAPAIISIHAINFHSTIRDFRTATLRLLDEFLASVERRWPDVHYIHDADLFRIATEGCYSAAGQATKIGASMQDVKQ
jgi:hypothetical protein